MSQSVIEFVLGRLRDIGINHIFGVPGDYSFSVEDAIVNFDGVEWVGCCNELNAAYAADGYARIHGVGAVNTTFAVGELSAINGIAGCYAERLPVFHLVGMPNMSTQDGRALVHHTFADGEFGIFAKIAQPTVCASAILTPQNAAFETERLIAEALFHRRPVYMGFPSDLADQPIVSTAKPLETPVSDPEQLTNVVEAILARLNASQTACILPGLMVSRTGIQAVLQEFIDRSGLPFATMFADKSVLDEQQSAYIGLYSGKLMEERVQGFVESAALVLLIGTSMTDINTGAFTARLDPAKTIDIRHHQTRIGSKVFRAVEMKDVLVELTKRVSKRATAVPFEATSFESAPGNEDDTISAEALYPRWAHFIRQNDIIIAETGTCSMGLAFARLPQGVTFHNQSLWGSIGWATPAAFGAAVAADNRRVLLFTGEGSHQLTVQEIGQFARRGLRPIIFVLNNSGYLIERLLCKDPDIVYNDVAQWRYSELPHAFGCDGWFTARVTTCGELDEALDIARTASDGVYIEVITDTYAASPLSMRIHESVKSLYRS